MSSGESLAGRGERQHAMGRSLRWGRRDASPGRPDENETATGAQQAHPWWQELAGNARAHGALPYVVEGFTEIVDAVRRGHPVLVRRERVEVADGITVFDVDIVSSTSTKQEGDPVVAILRFDVGTARFVLQDPASPVGGIQLTPKRLARYLDSPDRSTGVALGA